MTKAFQFLWCKDTVQLLILRSDQLEIVFWQFKVGTFFISQWLPWQHGLFFHYLFQNCYCSRYNNSLYFYIKNTVKFCTYSDQKGMFGPFLGLDLQTAPLATFFWDKTMTHIIITQTELRLRITVWGYLDIYIYLQGLSFSWITQIWHFCTKLASKCL